MVIFLLVMMLGMLALTGIVKTTALPAQAASDSGMQFDKAMVRQSDGTLVEDEGLSSVRLWPDKSLPEVNANAGNYTGYLVQFMNADDQSNPYSLWDENQYAFRGWQIGDTFYDGTQDKENSVKVTATDENGLKQYFTQDGWYLELYYVEYGSSACKGMPLYQIDFCGTTGSIKGVLHVTPVFEKKTDMANTISLAQTEGGTISQIRKDGEDHQLTAKPDAGYAFARWEKSTDGGKTWTTVEGEAKTIVTLTEDTTYRAVFESPYTIDTVDVQDYALGAEGNSWYLDAVIHLNQSCSDDLNYTVKVYEGENAAADKLLGETKLSVVSRLADSTQKITLTKRPSDTKGKILLVTTLKENGQANESTYQLSGTLDITAETDTVDTYQTAFLGKAPAELQLATKGDPEAKSVKWSGGDTSTQGSCSVSENTGLVSYTTYTAKRSAKFKATVADGRIAEKTITFTGTRFAKINEKKVTVAAGESKEYQVVTSPKDLKAQIITVKSSDESIFTVDVTTKDLSDFSKDVIDTLKINGIKKGTAKLTIGIGNNSAEWPVVIQSGDDAVTGVTLPAEKTMEVGDSDELDAVCTPETALVSLRWSSSAPGTVRVDNGKLTAVKAGSAVITVEATDKSGHTVSASCTVQVTEPLYTVKISVPKHTIATDGLSVYPATGTDADGRDTFDENTAKDVTADTESDVKYDIYTLSLYSGTYSYRAVDVDGKSLGGGSFTFPSSDTSSVDGHTAHVTLRLAEISVTNEFDGKKGSVDDFTVSLSNSEGSATLGEAYINKDGCPTYRALICANADALLYHTEIIPSEAYVDAHNVTDYRQKDIEVAKDASVLALTAELATGCFTINAPADADVALYERITTLKSLKVSKILPDVRTEQEDGTIDYGFHVNITTGMVYKVDGPDYVMYAGSVEDGSKERLVITESMLKPSGKTKTTLDRNVKSNGGVNLADLYMNINAQGYLSMNTGKTYQLAAKRNWWGSNVTWVMSNQYYVTDPDFHYTVLNLDGEKADDVVSVSDDGVITANGKGTAIVLVTYDAMTLNYHKDALVSYEGYNPNGFYGAIWPENTGVFVVSVDETAAGISTGMTINEGKNSGTSKMAGDAIDAELDPIYFLGNTGSYTFTPKTSGVSVSVANPKVQSGALSFDGFRTVSADTDGSYTVPLTEGRNIVRLEKNGAATYQVITAKHVSAKVNGVDLDKAVVAPGEKVSVKFDTLYAPLTRMRLYNIDSAPIYTKVSGYDGKLAGAARGSYGFYFFASTPEKQTVENFVTEGVDTSGYSNPIVSLGDDLTVPADYDGDEFTLSGGMFNTAGFGSEYGAHRTYEARPSGMSPNTMAYLGQLPDITIPVGTLDKIEVTKLPTKLEYSVGDTLDMTGMEVTATYNSSGNKKITRVVSDVTADIDTFNEAGAKKVTLSFTQAGVTKTAEIEVTVKNVRIERLEITKQPTKTLYKVGDAFDPTGMEVTAYYSDGTTRVVTRYTCTPDRLTAADTAVTVSFGGASVQVPVQMNLVQSIKLTTAPRKTAYKEGEIFSTSGMVITAVYTDNTEKTTTDYTCEPAARLKKADTSVTIRYTGEDAAADVQPLTQEITVGDAGKEPYDSITAYIAYSDKGSSVYGAEGTRLYYAPVTVYDRNEDGVYTMGDAFRALHAEYYTAGEDGYADHSTAKGGWVDKFWNGDANISYTLNHVWVWGPETEIEDGDKIDVYRYKDLQEYADLLTWFDADTYRVNAGEEKVYTVHGANIMNSSESETVQAAPTGATVTVYGKDQTVVTTTTVDEKGQFRLNFAEDGVYTVQVNGICTYSCAGYEGSAAQTYKNKVVVPSYCTVKVGTDAEEKVVNLINAINTEDYVGSFDKIMESKAAYDALTDAQKEKVTNYDVLQTAYAAVEDIVNVIKAIETLPENVTLNDRETVEAAKAAYEALTTEKQAAVPAADREKLQTACDAISQELGRAEQVMTMIKALPSTDQLTEADETAVQEARAAYEALSDELKALVTNLDVLVKAEQQMGYIKEAKEVREKIDTIGDVTIDNFDEKAELITAARTAYDLLHENAKALVTNIDTLKKAEETYALTDEDVKAVIDAVTALETPLKDSQEPNADLYAIWDQYSYAVVNIRGLADRLTEDQQKLVTNMSDLKTAEDYLSTAQETKAADDAYANAEKLLADETLPNADDLTEKVTAAQISAIAAAKEAYDALTDTQKDALKENMEAAVGNLEKLDQMLKGSEGTKDVYAEASKASKDETAAKQMLSALETVYGTYKDETVTRSDITVINQTLEQYDALTKAQKDLLDVSEVLDTLQTWADQVAADEKAAQEVSDLIKELPASLNADNMDTVREKLNTIVDKYNALNAQAQTYVRRLSKVEATNKVLNDLTAEMEAFKATEVTATVGEITYKSVALSWDTVDYAKSYEVYRKTATDDWTKLTETTGTSYSDQAVKADTAYTYKIIAVTDRWNQKRTESSFKEAEARTAVVPTPVLGGASVTAREAKTARVKLNASIEGEIRYLVQKASAGAPNAATLQSKGIKLTAVEGENTLAVTGLTCDSYKVYILLKTDAGTVSAVMSVEIPAIAHKAGAWTVTKAATCTGKGSREQRCTACGTVIRTEEIRATGHKAGAWTVTKAATCTENGSREQRCSVCGTVLKTEAIAATGHQFGGWVTTTQPTVLAEGVQTRTCAKCGQTERQPIAKLAATGKLSITKFPLKVKQRFTVRVEDMAAGDYVISWATSNKKIATITGTGKVTGKKKGKATITATLASGLKISTTVKVQKGTVKTKSIVVNGKNVTLNAKQRYQILAVIAPLTSQQKLTYSTSNKKIVKVDKKGRITAVKKGKATITVKSGSKKVKIKVTVK